MEEKYCPIKGKDCFCTGNKCQLWDKRIDDCVIANLKNIIAGNP